jgi:hypothetical protein
MTLDVLAVSLDFFGKFLIVVAAFMLHGRLHKEKRIDKRVIRQIRKEQSLGLAGIIIMALGYVVHLVDWFLV